MFLIISPTLFISGATTLASAILKVWETLDHRRERRLDREQEIYLEEARFHHDVALAEKQRYLLEAQLRHEEKLAGIAPHQQSSGGVVESDTDDAFIARLQLDAEKLAELEFEVVYERINNSYGLALTLGDYFTFAFLLKPGYPQQAPVVLLKKGAEIDQISFSGDAWSADIMLADIISNIVEAYLPYLPEITEEQPREGEDHVAETEEQPREGEDIEAETA